MVQKNIVKFYQWVYMWYVLQDFNSRQFLLFISNRKGEMWFKVQLIWAIWVQVSVCLSYLQLELFVEGEPYITEKEQQLWRRKKQ